MQGVKNPVSTVNISLLLHPETNINEPSRSYTEIPRFKKRQPIYKFKNNDSQNKTN